MEGKPGRDRALAGNESGGNTLGFEYPAFLVEEERFKLYDENLDLVIKILEKYLGRGTSLSDLFRAGREGLEVAAAKYNFDGGYDFRNFASFFIRKHIQMEMDLPSVGIPQAHR